MTRDGPLPLNVAPSSCCRPLTRWPSSSLRRCGRLPPPRLDAIVVCAADEGLALGRVLPLPLLLLLLQPLLQLLLQLLLLILLASSSLRPLSRASEPLLRSSQEGDPSLRALLLFGWLELPALDLTLRMDFIHNLSWCLNARLLANNPPGLKSPRSSARRTSALFAWSWSRIGISNAHARTYARKV